MGVFKVNPDAELKSFAPVKAGTYRMKIVKHTEEISQKGNNYFKFQLAFVDPADRLLGIDGQPLRGLAGSVFYNAMTNPEQQWSLRAIVEGALGSWRDFEPADLYGKEVTAVIIEDEYEGNINNKVSKILVG
jgi:hypothetical protein